MSVWKDEKSQAIALRSGTRAEARLPEVPERLRVGLSTLDRRVVW